MHYFSSKGVLLGVPGFLGYFFGVCLFLSIMNIWRSPASSGNLKVCVSVTLPPNTLIANFASSNSSSPFEDFNATNYPPFLISGKHNSLNTDNLATALAVTTS